jgi:mRNA-degrading endonuclease RelE of RelBE toxin-antitoxin system
VVAYRIDYTPRALGELRGLRANRRQVVADTIGERLRHQPEVPNRHRKPMRPNATATWELRVDPQRVLYDVDAGAQVVLIQRVVTKRGNRLVDASGQEVDLDGA